MSRMSREMSHGLEPSSGPASYRPLCSCAHFVLDPGRWIQIKRARVKETLRSLRMGSTWRVGLVAVVIAVLGAGCGGVKVYLTVEPSGPVTQGQNVSVV